MKTVNKWLSFDQLIGARCTLCAAKPMKLIDLCKDCYADLPHNHSYCRICANPLPNQTDGDICGQCLQSTPNYHTSITPFLYQEPIQTLIHGLKYHKQLKYAHLLGTMMATTVESALKLRPDFILPVPLHPRRLQERGYNQALELARPIAKKLKLPIEMNSCKRIRFTEIQTDLPAHKRINNVKDAFACTSLLYNKNIAIVDDVITTGSTVNELAKSLLSVGVRDIQIWACARA